MGKDSKIEWTDETFNPWWGCTKVSPGCGNCYAESLSHRYGHDIWGPGKTRRFFGDKHWAEPLKWNLEAGFHDTRFKVFCASMADVFEEGDGLKEQRRRLWDLIDATPNLDWLLLTKRPENVEDMVPWGLKPRGFEKGQQGKGWPLYWPVNVWIGTSVENQDMADRRLPHLLKIPARVRFLSCEPLLGPVQLDFDAMDIALEPDGQGTTAIAGRVDWVICGGESGPKYRDMSMAWADSLMVECRQAGVPFFMKQLGGFPSKRDKMADFPERLQKREFPVVAR